MSLKIGDVEDGYSFIGGEPSNKASWKKIGEVEDGYKYLGGDPSDKNNWEKHSNPLSKTTSTAKNVAEGAYSGVSNIAKSLGAGTAAAADTFILGGGDEVLGGAHALIDAASKGNLDDFFSDYRRYQEEYDKEKEQLREDYPISSGLGTGVGIVGQAILAPELGLAKGAGLGAKILQGAKIGAGYGAVGGALESKGNIENADKLIDDAAVGGLTGGLTGGALSGAGHYLGKGLDYLGNKIKSSPVAQQSMIIPFKEGEKYALGQGGWKYGDEKFFRENVVPASSTAAQKVSNIFKRMDDINSINFQTIFKDAENAGFRIKQNPIMKYEYTNGKLDLVLDNNPIWDALDKAGKDLFMGNESFRKYALGEEVTPQELHNIKKLIDNVIYESNNSTDIKFKLSNAPMQFSNFRNQVMNDLNKIPNFKEVNDVYGSVGSLKQKFLKGSLPDADYRDFEHFDRETQTRMLERAIKDLVENVEHRGISNMNTKERSFELFRLLKNADEGIIEVNTPNGVKKLNVGELESDMLFKALNDGSRSMPFDPNPIKGALSDYKVTPDKLENAISDFSKRYQSIIGTKSIAPHAEGFNKSLSMGLENTSSPAGGLRVGFNTTGRLFGASKEQLLDIANKLKAIPGTNHFGNSLERVALGDKTISKNAIIFSILQSKDGRQLLADEGYSQE